MFLKENVNNFRNQRGEFMEELNCLQELEIEDEQIGHCDCGFASSISFICSNNNQQKALKMLYL